MRCYLVNWFPFLSFLSLPFSFFLSSIPPFHPFFLIFCLLPSFFASPASLFLHSYPPLSLLFPIFIPPSFSLGFPSLLTPPPSVFFLSLPPFFIFIFHYLFSLSFFLRGETPVLSRSVFLASDPVLHVYTCLRSMSKQKTEM